MKRFTDKFGDSISYDASTYADVNTHMKMFCNKGHSEFWRRPVVHYNSKYGCPECWNKSKQYGLSEIIKLTESICKNKGFTVLNYFPKLKKYAQPLIELKCTKGHIFKRSLHEITHSVGCPFCQGRASKWETAVYNYIDSLGVPAIHGYRGWFSENTKLEIDIYIPKLKVGFECNGDFWHSEIKLNKDAHAQKYIKAKERGIQLFQIWESEWKDNKTGVEKFIQERLWLLPQSETSEDYFIRPVLINSLIRFMVKNYIGEYNLSATAIGLWSSNEVLVAVALFQDDGECIRISAMACSKNITGWERALLQYYKSISNTKKDFVFFSDNMRTIDTQVYNLGFTPRSYTPPQRKSIKLGSKEIGVYDAGHRIWLSDNFHLAGKTKLQRR